jgi:hypothetical protein
MKFFGITLMALASGAAAFSPAAPANGVNTALFASAPGPGGRVSAPPVRYARSIIFDQLFT